MSDWRAIAAKKKAKQQALIPKEWMLKLDDIPIGADVSRVPETCGLMTVTEIQITNSDVDDLLEKLAAGEWSSVLVTTAFYKRAIIAHQLAWNLAWVYGFVPDTNAADTKSEGYVSWVGTYAERNSVLADILDNAGAVLFVKTNVPQTLMWSETFNHIFGRTSNPYNRSLTSGGSSGGEGALVAFCGTYGLRPSYGRVPYAGCVNSLEGQDSVASVLGPLSNSLSGIKTFMKAVIDARPWLKDPLAVRKRWSDDEYNLADHGNGKNLCFAIMWDDGLVVPHPPIIRGLEVVKKALLNAGHKGENFIWFHFYDHDIWAAGAAEDYKVVTAVTGEPVIATMDLDDEISAVGKHEEHTNATVVIPGVSAYDLWQTHKQKRILREEYLQLWEDTIQVTGTGRAVDAIISPAAPYTAIRHGKNNTAQYTMVWNLLDYSSLVIPVSKVDPEIDRVKAPHDFYNREDKANYDLYNPANFANAPISVQLVGRTCEEEAVIAMGEIVVAALKRSNDVLNV
ncbi:hypothetical protein HHX47_DHR1001153 [Lentinula edodes]|nr:hypothetical protein HHX47_DHR1001153 [Lentinula edodes]